MSRVLSFSDSFPSGDDEAVIREGVSTILRGGLVVFPTETVYGIGCDPEYRIAVRHLYHVKNRPRGLPLTLHVSSLEMAAPYVQELSAAALALTDALWPGPLTVILPRSDRLHPDVVAGMSSVGLRMPDHPATLALIQAAGIPLAATSANHSGQASAAEVSQSVDDLGDDVDLYLDGGRSRHGVESTVIDLSSAPFKLLRKGAIPLPAIQAALEDAGIEVEIVEPEVVISEETGATYAEEVDREGVRVILHAPPETTPEAALRVAREVFSHHGSRASLALHECALVPAQLATGLRHPDGSIGDPHDGKGLSTPSQDKLYDEMRRMREDGVTTIHAVESPLPDDAVVSARLRRIAAYVVQHPPVG